MVVSVLLHLSALVWLGVAHAPESAGEMVPMELRLAMGRLEPEGVESRVEGHGSQGLESGSREEGEGTVDVPHRLDETAGSESPEMTEWSLTRKSAPVEPRPASIKTRETAMMSDYVVEPLSAADDLVQDDAAVSPAADEGTGPVANLDPGPITPDRQDLLLAYAGDPGALGLLSADGDDRSGGFIAAEVLRLPRPRYPVASRRRQEEGTVVLSLLVDPLGRVAEAVIDRSSGYRLLDSSARAAALEAVFVPARKGGSPVPSERRMAYTFRLEEQR